MKGMKRLSQKLLLTISLTLLIGGGQAFAQTLEEAKELYKQGNYEEAKPVFEKLVKKAPSNSSYNQWYGVCCFETGDIETAEKYIKVALKRKVQESYRYMGKIYYLTYRFEDAVEMFEEYISLLTKKKQDTEAFEEQLELAENAARMLDKVEDVQIIDSLVVDKDSFLSAYTLSEECGSLATYQDFFQTNEQDQTTVYMNQKGDKIHYAHTTDDEGNCLFTQSKLMDQWGDEKRLPMNINSAADDNYPFVLTDGVTIYFASKGNGSLGGYDIFITRYNIDSDSYLTPEQMGMPYNSPFNDYMMVIDENKGLGWFVSDRFQPEGKVCVYLFIPNDSRLRVDSEDEEWKRSRASISSIQDSWKAGANYSELIALAHTEIPYGPAEIQKDFTFPVMDDVIYYTLGDIQSPEAKKYYEKVIALNKQINELNDKLDGLRRNYSSGNKAMKDKLKPSILDAEDQLNTLLDQPHEWEKKARNAEVAYLQKQGK